MDKSESNKTPKFLAFWVKKHLLIFNENKVIITTIYLVRIKKNNFSFIFIRQNTSDMNQDQKQQM